MEYRQTDGKTRRVHKQYVDVVARILAGGQVVPVTVCWVDGRCFTIDEIVSSTGFGLTVHGIRTATYKVRFGGHATRSDAGRDGVGRVGPSIDEDGAEREEHGDGKDWVRHNLAEEG